MKLLKCPICYRLILYHHKIIDYNGIKVHYGLCSDIQYKMLKEKE